MPVDEEESIVDAVLKVQLNSNGVDTDGPPKLNGNSHHQQQADDETLEDSKEQSKQQQVGIFYSYSILFLATPWPRQRPRSAAPAEVAIFTFWRARNLPVVNRDNWQWEK